MFLLFVKCCYNVCSIYEQNDPKNRIIFNKIIFRTFSLFCICTIQSILWLKYCVIKLRMPPLIDDGIRPIVSLTSFPKRIKSVRYVIYSMYMQSILPAKIILVLSKQEFPNGMNDLPNSLKRLLGKGLEIVFIDYNLRPHNKYYYTFKNYENRNIITIDDDLFYWPSTIKRLVCLNSKYPSSICANSLSVIEFKNNKLFLKSSYVPHSENIRNMARGVCGVLYPPTFRPRDLFDKEKIEDLALSADDLWLKAHAMRQNFNVIAGEFYPSPFFLTGSQDYALRFTNVECNQNEKQWLQLHNYYRLEQFNY